ncbi:hypothetical protein [Nocardia sp. CA-290969]|uniref:hypothetical protein n=1 Tax=Nocardia sp. CA-290969 TaxID=3239986 RepID=UPI003D944E96
MLQPWSMAAESGLSKSSVGQIQALDRSAPVLPMMPGMPERRTHDYIRHGITTLSLLEHRHRAGDRFDPSRNRVQEVPDQARQSGTRRSGCAHLICDNYGTHKASIFVK